MKITEVKLSWGEIVPAQKIGGGGALWLLGGYHRYTLCSSPLYPVAGLFLCVDDVWIGLFFTT